MSRTTTEYHNSKYEARHVRPVEHRVSRVVGWLVQDPVRRPAEPGRAPTLPLNIFEPRSGSERLHNTAHLRRPASGEQFAGQEISLKPGEYRPLATAQQIKETIRVDLGVDLMAVISLPRPQATEDRYQNARTQAMTQLYVMRDQHGPQGARVIVLSRDQLEQAYQHMATGGQAPKPKDVLVVNQNDRAMIGAGQHSWLPPVQRSREAYPPQAYSDIAAAQVSVGIDTQGVITIEHEAATGSTAVLHGAVDGMPAAMADPWAQAEWANRQTYQYPTVPSVN